MNLEGHPAVRRLFDQARGAETQQPAGTTSNCVWLHRLAVDRGTDDAGSVEITRPGLDPQRDEILRKYRRTKSLLSQLYVWRASPCEGRRGRWPTLNFTERFIRSTDRLFVGIDHTAIVVSDTERSLKFYRVLLGLRVVGESVNYGTEQEHLTNVFGAHLRVTSLRGRWAPGVELLEYLTPGDGWPFPVDERANDLINWQIRMLTLSPYATRYLRAARIEFLSSDELSIPGLGITQAVTVRDPDGHQIELIRR